MGSLQEAIDKSSVPAGASSAATLPSSEPDAPQTEQPDAPAAPVAPQAAAPDASPRPAEPAAPEGLSATFSQLFATLKEKIIKTMDASLTSVPEDVGPTEVSQASLETWVKEGDQGDKAVAANATLVALGLLDERDEAGLNLFDAESAEATLALQAEWALNIQTLEFVKRTPETENDPDVENLDKDGKFGPFTNGAGQQALLDAGLIQAEDLSPRDAEFKKQMAHTLSNETLVRAGLADAQRSDEVTKTLSKAMRTNAGLASGAEQGDEAAGDQAAPEEPSPDTDTPGAELSKAEVFTKDALLEASNAGLTADQQEQLIDVNNGLIVTEDGAKLAVQIPSDKGKVTEAMALQIVEAGMRALNKSRSADEQFAIIDSQPALTTSAKVHVFVLGIKDAS